MGAGWRRFAEKSKQKWNITTEKAFVSTSNARNEAMLREAGDFANHLKRCEKDIRSLKDATEGMLNTTKIVMSAALPRVYEDAGGGKANPVAAAPGPTGTIGGDFRVEELTRVSKETSKKLEAEVLAPMQRWTTAYNTVLTRMQRLEGVRLEVDSRRRTVAELARKIDRQRARLPQTRSKGEFEMEQTIKKMQHKENKLSGARVTFKEQEALVYQQLAQLIRDAVWLKSYLAAVMRLEQEAFQHAYAALGPTKGSLPAIPALPPVMEPPPAALPGTPDHGLPISGREPSPQNVAGVPQPMRSLSNKVMRRPLQGKENGQQPFSNMPAGPPGPGMVPANVYGKESYGGQEPLGPPVPINRINRPPSGAYDRYGAAEPAYRETVPAW